MDLLYAVLIGGGLMLIGVIFGAVFVLIAMERKFLHRKKPVDPTMLKMDINSMYGKHSVVYPNEARRSQGLFDDSSFLHLQNKIREAQIRNEEEQAKYDAEMKAREELVRSHPDISEGEMSAETLKEKYGLPKTRRTNYVEPGTDTTILPAPPMPQAERDILHEKIKINLEKIHALLTKHCKDIPEHVVDEVDDLVVETLELIKSAS